MKKATVCEKCSSGNLQSFKGELAVAFRQVENVNQAPVYLIQDLWVCLDCGYTGINFPPAKLEQLRQKALEPEARRSFGQGGSHDS
jgi:hypothetical protein